MSTYIHSKYMISQHFTYFHQPSFCIFVRQWRCVETHKPQAVVAQILGGKEIVVVVVHLFRKKSNTSGQKKVSPKFRKFSLRTSGWCHFTQWIQTPLIDISVLRLLWAANMGWRPFWLQCQEMVWHGTQFIILFSRNPNFSNHYWFVPSWLKSVSMTYRHNKSETWTLDQLCMTHDLISHRLFVLLMRFEAVPNVMICLDS